MKFMRFLARLYHSFIYLHITQILNLYFNQCSECFEMNALNRFLSQWSPGVALSRTQKVIDLFFVCNLILQYEVLFARNCRIHSGIHGGIRELYNTFLFNDSMTSKDILSRIVGCPSSHTGWIPQNARKLWMDQVACFYCCPFANHHN